MLGHFLVVLSQVGTLFLLMSVGYIMGRKKHLSAVGTAQMSTLLLYVVTPCIMIEALQADRTPELLTTIYNGSLATVGFYMMSALGSFLLFRRQPEDRRGVLKCGSIYGNVGFLGLPLVQAVLGNEAVILCVINIVFFNIFEWSHGVATMGGKVTARQMVLNPASLSLIIGMLLFLNSVRLPDTMLRAIGFLADLNTPLAMVVIGFQMSAADFKTTFTRPLLYCSAAVKLLLVPAVTALVLLPIGLDRMLYCVLVVLAAAPTAGITGIFAQRFERDAATAAQLITLTTLLSAITLPLFAMIAQRLAG